jgi:hypothetical protein
MFSLLHVQILADLLVFITILFLLWRLNGHIPRRGSTVDPSLVSELKKILADSHEATNNFLEAIEESRKLFNKLFLQLDDKEKKLADLIREAEVSIKKLDSAKSVSEEAASEKKYDDVIRMIQQGLSREDVSKQSGFTEGEVNLIADLAKTRTGSVS